MLRLRIVQVVLTILFLLSIWLVYRSGYERGYRDGIRTVAGVR